jgi:peptide subunit release factor 1 (eRF1)
MRGGEGGGRQEEETVLRNLRDAAASAEQFFRHTKVRRLFLGGTQGNVAQFRDYLSKQMQSFVAGTFVVDVDASEAEIRDRTLEMLRQVNTEREQQLVQMMITTAAKAGNAVVGLDDTFKAVSEGRVQQLVVSDGYRQPGYKQDAAHFVTVNLALSPYAENELDRVDDVIDAAVTYTMANGGRVEVITDNSALDRVGHIGAILRY